MELIIPLVIVVAIYGVAALIARKADRENPTRGAGGGSQPDRNTNLK